MAVLLIGWFRVSVHGRCNDAVQHQCRCCRRAGTHLLTLDCLASPGGGEACDRCACTVRDERHAGPTAALAVPARVRECLRVVNSRAALLPVRVENANSTGLTTARLLAGCV